MDAFAVAACKGLALKRLSVRHMLTAGGWFGGFQALMPMMGYGLGTRFKEQIATVDHWIAFVLLGVIGADMIRDACNGEDRAANGSFAWREMLFLSLATSVDALAVGMAFAFLEVNILAAAALTGTVTFLFSMAGVKAGNAFGSRYKAKAELAGGGILILLGVKILLEHLAVL